MPPQECVKCDDRRDFAQRAAVQPVGLRGTSPPIVIIDPQRPLQLRAREVQPVAWRLRPGRRPSWIHGYPLAERNLMKIMNEVTFIDAHEEINACSKGSSKTTIGASG